MKLVILGMFLLLGTTPAFGQAVVITDPTELSPQAVLIDFESVPTGGNLVTAVPNPFVVGDVTFASLTGNLSVFDISVSGWPADGTEVSSRTLFPGGEPDSAISIVFASPVSEVLLGWGDPNFAGNVLRAFDAHGSLLQEATVEVGSPGGGHAAWIGFKRPTPDIAQIVVQPDQSLPFGDDYVIDNIYYSASAEALLLDLINQVIGLNLQTGLLNSLDAKLYAALVAIDANNYNRKPAAMKAIDAFILAVRTQRGRPLTPAQADALIVAAQRVKLVIAGTAS